MQMGRNGEKSRTIVVIDPATTGKGGRSTEEKAWGAASKARAWEMSRRQGWGLKETAEPRKHEGRRKLQGKTGHPK